MSEFLTIGDVVYCEGVTGVVDDVEFDEDGQLIGFILRDGTRAHHYNLDMMLDEARSLRMN